MDTGWTLIKQERSADLAIACDCQKTSKEREGWQRAGINTEMSKQNFGNFEEWNDSSKHAKAIAIAYYRAFG